MFRSLWLVAALLVGLTASSTEASQELRDKMADLAKDVLANTRSQPVTVGQFSPTGLPDTNSGPGIESLLTTELERIRKGSVREDALYEVKGDYALVRSRNNPDLKEVKIAARVIEKETGDELKDLRVEARLDGNNTIAEILQVTASLDPQGTKESRNRELERRAKEERSVFVHGAEKTLVSSAEGSDYAMEILAQPLSDSSEFPPSPRPIDLENGQAFVPLERDEVYEIKLYNFSSREAAVAVKIDGIDVFHFSQDRDDKGRPRFTHLIMPAGSQERPATMDLVGWHNRLEGNENYLSFLVTEHGKGAAGKAGISARGQIGVVHVQFSNCRPLPPGAKGRSGNETGFGPPREVKQQAVRYEIDPPHDFISVRYAR